MLTCETAATTSADVAAGVTESQLCEPADEAIGQLTLQTYADAAGLREAWQTDADNTADLEIDEAVCANATPDADKWGFGNLLCGVRDGTAEIRWTDTRSGTYGIVESATADLDTLHKWWRENARPLGRPAGGATATDEADDTAPATPKPTPKPGPLVRVPGKPNNATCKTSIDPISDEWDRTWNITTVNFENKNGYERVVINLQRSGKNRSTTPTRTAVKRMTAANLDANYRRAPTPTKGKLAIVLDIDGIDDSPTLFNFEPSNLDYMRQLSIFKSNGGYTTAITTPSAICYQVRIPVWSNAATGNERTAQIYVDLKPR